MNPELKKNLADLEKAVTKCESSPNIETANQIRKTSFKVMFTLIQKFCFNRPSEEKIINARGIGSLEESIALLEGGREPDSWIEEGNAIRKCLENARKVMSLVEAENGKDQDWLIGEIANVGRRISDASIIGADESYKSRRTKFDKVVQERFDRGM